MSRLRLCKMRVLKYCVEKKKHKALFEKQYISMIWIPTLVKRHLYCETVAKTAAKEQALKHRLNYKYIIFSHLPFAHEAPSVRSFGNEGNLSWYIGTSLLRHYNETVIHTCKVRVVNLPVETRFVYLITWITQRETCSFNSLLLYSCCCWTRKYMPWISDTSHRLWDVITYARPRNLHLAPESSYYSHINGSHLGLRSNHVQQVQHLNTLNIYHKSWYNTP